MHLWIEPEALDDTIELSVRQQACELATFILWSLSGRRFHPQQARSETYRMQRCCWNWIDLWWPIYDVQAVTAINVCTLESLPITEGWYFSGRRLYLRDVMGDISTHCTGCPERTLEVVYDTPSNLPPGTAAIVYKLANEMVLAQQDSSLCSLPQRIQTISRSNVSWTLLDPQDFLEGGRTGITFVDEWLSAANPSRLKQKVRLFQPSAPRLIKSEEWVAC